VGQIPGLGSIPQQGAQFAQINLRSRRRAVCWIMCYIPAQLAHAVGPGDHEVAARCPLTELSRRVNGRVRLRDVRSVAGISLPVQIELRGQDIRYGAKFAERVRARMETIKGVLRSNVSVRSGKPEVRVSIDSLRAAQFHISPALAGQSCASRLRQHGHPLRAVGHDVPVRVQAASLHRDDPRAVGEIIVEQMAQGAPVALPTSRPSHWTAARQYRRNDGQRFITISANLAPDTPLGNCAAVIQREIDAIRIPALGVHWSGDAKRWNETRFPSALLF